MWAQLLTALLDWLTKLVKNETRKTGEDAPVNSGARDKLNDRLDAWKKKNGAP